MSQTNAHELGKRATRAVAWNLLNIVASRALSLVVFAVLCRILDRSAFGVVALTLSLLALLEVITSQSVGDFVVQCRELDEEYLNSVFWVNVVLSVTFGALFTASAESLSTRYGDPDLVPISRLLALTLVTNALGIVPAALLARELRFRELTTRNLAASIVGGAAGIAAAVSGLGAMSLVVQILVGAVVSLYLLWRKTTWRPGLSVSAAKLKIALRFGTPMLGASLLYCVSRRADTLFVGDALGIVALGAYVLGQRVTQIVGQVLHKSNDAVFFSTFSVMDAAEREHALLRGIRLSCMICFPVYVGLALVAEPLTVTVFGAKWISSAPVLSILSIACLFFGASTFNSIALKSMGLTSALLRVHLVLTSVFLVALYLLAPLGLAEAALATLVAYAVAYPLEGWLTIRATGVPVRSYLGALRVPFFTTAIMAAGVFGARLAFRRLELDVAPIADLVFSVLVGIASYALALRVLDREAWGYALGKLRLRELRFSPRGE